MPMSQTWRSQSRNDRIRLLPLLSQRALPLPSQKDQAGQPTRDKSTKIPRVRQICPGRLHRKKLQTIRRSSFGWVIAFGADLGAKRTNTKQMGTRLIRACVRITEVDRFRGYRN